MNESELQRLAELEAKEAKRNEYKKQHYIKKKASLTEEQKEEIRKTERERKQKERANLTDAEREAIKEYDRQRKSKEKLTEEQLEKRREYNREYKRKQAAAKKNEPIADLSQALKELKKGTAVLTETKAEIPVEKVEKVEKKKSKVKVNI